MYEMLKTALHDAWNSRRMRNHVVCRAFRFCMHFARVRPNCDRICDVLGLGVQGSKLVVCGLTLDLKSQILHLLP